MLAYGPMFPDPSEDICELVCVLNQFNVLIVPSVSLRGEIPFHLKWFKFTTPTSLGYFGPGSIKKALWGPGNKGGRTAAESRNGLGRPQNLDRHTNTTRGEARSQTCMRKRLETLKWSCPSYRKCDQLVTNTVESFSGCFMFMRPVSWPTLHASQMKRIFFPRFPPPFPSLFIPKHSANVKKGKGRREGRAQGGRLGRAEGAGTIASVSLELLSIR